MGNVGELSTIPRISEVACSGLLPYKEKTHPSQKGQHDFPERPQVARGGLKTQKPLPRHAPTGWW